MEYNQEMEVLKEILRVSCNTSSGAAGTCTIKTTFASGETALTDSVTKE